MNNLITSQQAGALKTALQRRFEALHEEVRQDLIKTEVDREAGLADRVRDLGDESLATLITDLDLADTDRDLEELQDVEAALARMAQGAYGACVNCGEPIPFERLSAHPTAKRCQPCQALQEKTFVHKGLPTL
jgi:DnaK suppressor protein